MWRDLNEGGNRPKKMGGYQLAYVVECYCLLNCVLVDRFRFFRGTCCLLKGRLVPVYKTFWCSIPKGNILKNYQLEKLRFQTRSELFNL